MNKPWDMKYHIVKDGEWFRPKRKGWRDACCHCGLVHVVDLRIVYQGLRPVIEMRARQEERATAAMRRPMKFTKERED